MKSALTALLASTLLVACASTPASTEAATAATTVILVRHAEKAADGSKDPPLTDAGQARAQALSMQLEKVPLAAVYSTSLQRTQQTAAPTAKAHALSVITYDAKQPAPQFAAQLQRDNAGKTVLVVGHSNTVPGIAAALCQCRVAEMPETEYDRLTTVRIDADGQATLQESRQR